MSKLSKSAKPAKVLPSIEKRLTWEETYQEAAHEREDWSGLDVALMDGLDPKERW